MPVEYTSLNKRSTLKDYVPIPLAVAEALKEKYPTTVEKSHAAAELGITLRSFQSILYRRTLSSPPKRLAKLMEMAVQNTEQSTLS
jgi:hypothetical protein